MEQPFEADDRYSIAVTHNCPWDIISSISFSLTWDPVEKGSVVVKNYDTNSTDAELVKGINGVVVYAKTDADWGIDQDFGIWYPKDDGVPGWSYSY